MEGSGLGGASASLVEPGVPPLKKAHSYSKKNSI